MDSLVFMQANVAAVLKRIHFKDWSSLFKFFQGEAKRTQSVKIVAFHTPHFVLVYGHRYLLSVRTLRADY